MGQTYTIHCKNKDEVVHALEFLEGTGITWVNGYKPTEFMPRITDDINLYIKNNKLSWLKADWEEDDDTLLDEFDELGDEYDYDDCDCGFCDYDQEFWGDDPARDPYEEFSIIHRLLGDQITRHYALGRAFEILMSDDEDKYLKGGWYLDRYKEIVGGGDD